MWQDLCLLYLKHVTCVCLYWTNFNLLVFNLFLLFAGEAGETHVGQLGQRIGCMVRIEYGMGVPVSG